MVQEFRPISAVDKKSTPVGSPNEVPVSLGGGRGGGIRLVMC